MEEQVMQTMYLNKAVTRVAIAFIAALSVFLLIRNNGLYPMVFADEFTYSKFSRLVPMSDSLLPNYLYFFVYRVTNVCGEGFLGCARIINVVFLAALAPVIYIVCRKIAGKVTALAIATLAVCGQLSSYTAYFMPECMYALAFWLCTWVTLNYKREEKITAILLLGFAWGLSSLVKPHTLFLLPAIAAYVIYAEVFGSNRRIIHGLRNGLLVASSAVAVKMVAGLLIAGENGLSFFGRFYSQYANAVVDRDSSYYINLVDVALVSLAGHVMVMVVLYSVPVLAMIAFWYSVIKNGKVKKCEDAGLIVYATLVMSSLLVVTAIFTASVSNSEPAHHLHVRYYVFAIPLMLMASACSLRGDVPSVGLKARLAMAIPVLLVVVYAASVRFMPFEVHSTTAPEVFSVLSSDAVFYGVIVLSVLSVAIWAMSPRMAFIFYIAVMVPVLTLVTLVSINDQLMLSAKPDVYDRAAEFANSYLERPERQDVVIVGSESEVGGLFRTLFHLDLSFTDYGIQTVGKDGAYKFSDLPSGKKWVLLIGEHPIVGEKLVEIPGNGYSLIKAK